QRVQIAPNGLAARIYWDACELHLHLENRPPRHERRTLWHALFARAMQQSDSLEGQVVELASTILEVRSHSLQCVLCGFHPVSQCIENALPVRASRVEVAFHEFMRELWFDINQFLGTRHPHEVAEFCISQFTVLLERFLTGSMLGEQYLDLLFRRGIEHDAFSYHCIEADRGAQRTTQLLRLQSHGTCFLRGPFGAGAFFNRAIARARVALNVLACGGQSRCQVFVRQGLEPAHGPWTLLPCIPE